MSPDPQTSLSPRPPSPASAPFLPADVPARRPRSRRLTVVLLVLTLFGFSQPAAFAAPQDANDVPPNLRQYVKDTPEWTSSDWMTSVPCKDSGGDFSIYAQNVIKDTPELLAYFQPGFGGGDPARAAAIADGYRQVAQNISVPAGYCVDRVKQWAVPDPNFKPFGFQWGNADGEHKLAYGCNNTIGADLAPCGGFYLSCDRALTQQDHQQCEAWNAFSDDFVRQAQAARDKAINQHRGIADADTKNIVKSPSEIAQDFMDWTVKSGVEQVVAFVITGVIQLWGVVMKLVVDYSSPNLAGKSFTSVYNLIAGIALAVAFLGWLATLATSWKQGRIQFSLLGGLKAAVGVTLAGVGAILMLQLADECTKSLITAGADLTHQADFTQSLAKTNPLVALIVGTLIAIFLIFAAIFLVLHGPLVLMWALMGSIAAAGQVHPASAGWLAKWSARLTALAWSKFLMVGVMLLAQTMLLPMDAGQDIIRQIVDVVQGLALSAMLIATPALLWELVDFVSDRVGGASASGGPAAGHASSAAMGAAGSAKSAAASGINSAVSGMRSVGADLASKFPGGSTGGGAGGDKPGGAKPPRAEGGGAPSGGGSGSKNESPPPSGPPDPPAEGGGTPPAANLGKVVARGASGGGGGGGQISGWEGQHSGGGSKGGSGGSAAGGGSAGRGAPKVPPP